MCVPGSGVEHLASSIKGPSDTLGANVKSKSCIKISIFFNRIIAVYNNENHTSVRTSRAPYGPKWWKNQDRNDNQGRYSDKLKICRQITFNLKYAGKKNSF